MVVVMLIVLIMYGLFLLFNEVVYFSMNESWVKFRKFAIAIFFISTCCSGYYLEIKLSIIFIWLAIWLIIVSYFNRKKFWTILPLAGVILILVIGGIVVDIVHKYYQCTEIKETIDISNLETNRRGKYLTISEKVDKSDNKEKRIYYYYPEDRKAGHIYYIYQKDAKLYYIEDGEQAYLETKIVGKVTYDLRQPENTLDYEFIRYERTFFVPEETVENNINNIEE